MIRAILMDIDNTLLSFDAFVRKAMSEGFRKYKLPPYEDWMFGIFCEVNDTLWRGIEMGTNTMEDVRRDRWRMIFEKLGICFDGPSFEDYFRKTLWECAIPEEGADETVRYLAGKYVLCTASNGPFEQQVHRIGLAGWSDCFSEMFISEKIGASKPSAGFFRECIRILDQSAKKKGEPPYAKEEILMIGDSITADMEGAAEFGLKTCFYDRKNTGTYPDRYDLTVSFLPELKKLI